MTPEIQTLLTEYDTLQVHHEHVAALYERANEGEIEYDEPERVQQTLWESEIDLLHNLVAAIREAETELAAMVDKAELAAEKLAIMRKSRERWRNLALRPTAVQS